MLWTIESNIVRILDLPHKEGLFFGEFVKVNAKNFLSE